MQLAKRRDAEHALSRVHGKLPAQHADVPQIGRFTVQRADIFIIVPFMLLTVALRILSGPHTIDDAYITFRYAENLANGKGFVFNLGDHVLGTSTPLYTMCLALLTKITHVSLADIGLGIAILSDAVTTAVLYVLVRHTGTGRFVALLVTITFGLNAAVLFYSTSGMETSFFTCLLLVACWRFVENDQVGWGLATGLAILTRMEGILLALVLIAFHAWSHSKSRHLAMPWRAASIIGAICLPWVVFAVWYFGQPIPQSALAKSGLVLGRNALANVLVMEHHMGTLLVGSGRLGGPILAVLAALLWRYVGSRARNFRAALLFIALFVVAYTIMGLWHHIMADWYDIPLIPFYCLVLFTGAHLTLLSTKQAYRHVFLGIILCLVVFLQARQLQLGVASGKLYVQNNYYTTSREAVYAAFCDQSKPLFIDRHVVIAAPEIGTLGYFCQTNILDAFGLVTRGVARYSPDRDYGVPFALIDARKPEYVVSLEVFIRHTLLRDPRFHREYAQVAHITEINHIKVNAFGSDGLFVFRKRKLYG